MATPSVADKKNADQLLSMLSDSRPRNRLLPADFMELVISRVGGPGSFADIVAKILKDPQVAGIAKQRIISDMTRLMQHVEVKSKPPPDLSTLPTEDLRQELQAVLDAINAQQEKVPGNPAQQPG